MADEIDDGSEQYVETQETQPDSEIQAEEVKAKEEEIPQKYRGKGVADLIKMHQNAEQLASRHAQEVGEVRRLADELIKSQLTKKPEVEQPKVDFFENPDEAIRQAVENNPKVRAAEEYAMQVQRQMAAQQLAAKHPDFMDVNADPEFQSWVQSTNVRKKLYQDANNYDFEAADELLSTFKQLRTVQRQAVSDVEKKAREATLRAASVDTSGTGETGKKTYSRAFLINKRIHDPNWIAQNQEEISRAYREGRVK